MFVFLQSKLKYFPKIFIFEQGVLFVKLSFVNIMVRKIICSEISAITVFISTAYYTITTVYVYALQ